MPLKNELRDEVTSYVLKHVVPKNITPRPRRAMDWFKELFEFVEDEKLKDAMAEAFYQARFMGRLIEALQLKGDFNNGLIKAQTVLYASIYEAVIDYGLDTR